MEEIIKNVFIASFATVGIVETAKNFIKTEKKWIYALVMIPMAIGCYAASVLAPSWVIGGLLTVGVTQLGYQTIVQVLNNFIKKFSEKKLEEKQ